MNPTDLEKATNVALGFLAAEFGFDCREVLSTENIGDADGDPVVRILVRLYASAESIEKTVTAESDSANDPDVIREFLGRGTRVCVAVTKNRVVSHQLLDIQLS